MPEQKPFDRNACAVVGFRGIGRGHSAIETLFGFRNFIYIMGKDSFNEMSKDVAKSYSKVAKRSMLEAAKELNSGVENLCNIGISWMVCGKKEFFPTSWCSDICGHW